jgi:hypothetical protein
MFATDCVAWVRPEWSLDDGFVIDVSRIEHAA